MQTRFQDDPNVYKSFLAILNMYRNKEKNREEVLQMVGVWVSVYFLYFFYLVIVILIII